MLIYSLILYLLSCAINLKKDKSILYSRIFILVLFNSCFIGYNLLYVSFLNKGIGVFGGLFNITSLNSIFNIFVLLLSGLIGFLTSFYSRKVWLKEQSTIYKTIFSKLSFNKGKILNVMSEQYKITEYTLILLFIILGGIFLMASNDLVSVFLSIELQSYGLYIISSIYRNSESSTSAGLTYFLLGALASCFILLSTGLLYANSGCTNLDNLYIISNLSEILKDISHENNSDIIYWYSPYYLHFSFIILSIGFLFKVSAAPFHFWSPDVYDAVPTIVTSFIAIVPKITIFIFILDLVNHASISLYMYDFTWTTIFVISSFLSLIIGTVLGLTQTRIKRLYAYSTISHIGFILLALSINSRESVQAFLFYLAQYSISNLNAFMILICAGYSLYCYIYNKNTENEGEKHNASVRFDNISDKYDLVWKERNNSPIQLIDQMKGYFTINPVLSISLAITLFSFTGVPPLIGFFGKLMVLSASIDNGFVFMSIIAILTSVIGGVYYLAIIKQIFFEKSNYMLNPDLKYLELTGIVHEKSSSSKAVFGIKNILLSSSLTITISILTSVILLFIFVPSEILNITSIISMIIFNY